MIYSGATEPRWRRSLVLFPLMDMFFILLMFYLALALEGTPQQSRIRYLTPNDALGRAQILIQAITPDSVVWIDIIEYDTCLVSELENKVDNYKNVLGPCIGEDIYLVIRCPGN